MASLLPKSSVLCHYFMQGNCSFNTKCQFSHDKSAARPSTICKFYVQGNCTYGTRCHFNHVKPGKRANNLSTHVSEHPSSSGSSSSSQAHSAHAAHAANSASSSVHPAASQPVAEVSAQPAAARSSSSSPQRPLDSADADAAAADAADADAAAGPAHTQIPRPHIYMRNGNASTAESGDDGTQLAAGMNGLHIVDRQSYASSAPAVAGFSHQSTMTAFPVRNRGDSAHHDDGGDADDNEDGNDVDISSHYHSESSPSSGQYLQGGLVNPFYPPMPGFMPPPVQQQQQQQRFFDMYGQFVFDHNGQCVYVGSDGVPLIPQPAIPGAANFGHVVQNGAHMVMMHPNPYMMQAAMPVSYSQAAAVSDEQAQADMLKKDGGGFQPHSEHVDLAMPTRTPPKGPSDAQTERSELVLLGPEYQEKLEASRDVECSICLEVVLSKPDPAERKFGILPGCTHPFCLTCIRNWRGSTMSGSVIRACPICRVPSHFVTPSSVFLSSDEDKRRLIHGYRDRLRAIPCKYFNFGEGTCPFSTSCFYSHALRDGTVEEVRLRHIGTAEGETKIVSAIRLSDFIAAREARSDGNHL
ncbi:zinc finger family protein [Capsaspora owczarzaki ATCC 30864]|uniref:Zinc finger family protein n=1 Tax=Capsaspora owczarzaki (strain ATCC 30864) TaxID=595528 RepID=A0A0D2U313_CAPO3|nr:zinc finger family protein [Capsaspora owczarzaki ATCC 30864]KJE89566.1 zinc finger family protein [Capsaspora owczarzaki ATCC 30864]|eukprot:XP_004365881.1 zinc finger family protein [Capsaspora owczarzaki ATCC 30864]